MTLTTIVVGVAIILIMFRLWYYVEFQHPGAHKKRPSREVEPAHLIRSKSDGYPMTVNDSQLSRALATDDYELVEKYTSASGGLLYSDGETDTQIPPGYKIKDGHLKKDKRLWR